MPVPGQVTSNVLGGSKYQEPIEPMEELALQKYADEQAEKQKREWELGMEKNRAAGAARAQAEYDRQHGTPDQILKAAFDAMYGPQIQRAYQETAVGSAPVNSLAGRARDYAIQRGGATGGYFGQPGSDPVTYAVGMAPPQGGGQPQISMSPQQIRNTLDNMWRQQIDPYQVAAGQMGGFMSMFHPSNVWKVSEKHVSSDAAKELEEEKERERAKARKATSYTEQMF